MEEKIAETVEKARPAIAALKNYQQADMDGIVVTVSRQAVHEVADAFEVIAQALSGICVEVAELEWVKFGADHHALPDEYIAETPLANYRIIGPMRDGTWHAGVKKLTSCSREHFPEAETLDAAKAACQRDFASRISSCLKTRTVEEVRREYLEELIALAGDGCAKITDASPSRMREALGAACWLRSLQQEGKSDA